MFVPLRMRALFPPTAQVKMEDIKSILDSTIKGPRNLADVVTPRALDTIIKACEQAKESGYKPHKDVIIVDHNSSYVNWAAGYSPCITATRGASHGHWITHLRRVMSISEMVKLMGVRPERVAAWSEHVSVSAFGHVIGNAVHVGLIKRLLQ